MENRQPSLLGSNKHRPSSAAVVCCCLVSALLAVLLTCLYYEYRYKPLRALSGAMELVKKNYYFVTEETEEQMLVGALRGLAANLGDDYAEYYTKEEYEELVQSNSGTFIGMGVLVSDEGENGFIITEVYDASPAQEAGLLPGDRLLSANGQAAAGLALDEFLAYITHEEGDVNTILIRRGEQELSFTMVMRPVYTPYVSCKMLGEGIGYIYISGFHGQVVSETKEAIGALREQGMEGLVLDVRDNLGGSLSDVCAVADLFLPRDCLITTVKSRVNEETVYRTHASGLDMPIAMLTNGSSASASELLAGALKDNNVAELFGTVTFGKGIVQTFYDINFGADGTIKFTTDAYYTPSGVCIQGTGITPDHVVELPEDVTYYSLASLPYEQDTQLQAAVAYLQGITE